MNHQSANLPFIECHINTSLEICETRDTKGLYAKARSGALKGDYDSYSINFLDVLQLCNRDKCCYNTLSLNVLAEFFYV